MFCCFNFIFREMNPNDSLPEVIVTSASPSPLPSTPSPAATRGRGRPRGSTPRRQSPRSKSTAAKQGKGEYYSVHPEHLATLVFLLKRMATDSSQNPLTLFINLTKEDTEAEDRPLGPLLLPQQFSELYSQEKGHTSKEASPGTTIAPSYAKHEESVLSKVSASGLGRYFHLNCHRFLSYSTLPLEHRDHIIPYYTDTASSGEEDALQQAIIQGGFDWEDKITSEILGKDKVVQPEKNSHSSSQFFTHAETLQLLRTVQPGAHFLHFGVKYKIYSGLSIIPISRPVHIPSKC